MKAARGNIEINYEVEGAGPPVMLVHGVGTDLRSWDAVAARLAPRYRIIRLDLCGHGRSSRITTCTLQDFLDDVTAVLDAEGIAKTHLIGFSLGGMIAQAYVLDHPARIDRVAFISAVACRTPEELTRLIGRAKILREQGIAAVVAAAEDRWFTEAFKKANPERVQQRLAELQANDFPSYCAAYQVFAESEVGDRLPAIRHKTLIATGEHDIGSNTRMARYMHQAIPGSTLEILPGLRHSLLIEAPDEVARLIEAHLRD